MLMNSNSLLLVCVYVQSVEVKFMALEPERWRESVG